ncbi:hypothetical protein [Haloarchaeobius amylolyticus]|uniref:hypothetical protein n=1 Tax=Haloarchaeobius amylolyticus TaxID=1198296 RepID=UPI00226E59CF|nr:hypothetical protein [Haloarchaeobius amylolyticus]
MENEDPSGEPHTYHLELWRDGDLQFEESIPIRGRTDQRAYNALVSPPDFESVVGDWLVRVRVDDESNVHEVDCSRLLPRDGCLNLGVGHSYTGRLSFAQVFYQDHCNVLAPFRDDA